MSQSLPKILPVNELKNTANIMKTCKESKVPIIITKNGYAEAVMMSVELYEDLISKIEEVVLINAGLEEIERDAPSTEGSTFFDSMRRKYTK